MEEKLRFLLIDDSSNDLFLHQELLHDSGIECEIITYSSGRDAIEYLKNQNEHMCGHVILSDLHMPGFNGFEFIENITLLPDFVKNRIQFFLITSTMNQAEIKKAKSYPLLKEIFPKPLDVTLIEKSMNKKLPVSA